MGSLIMCSYSFVSIFAFILAFYVSTGNADTQVICYECRSHHASPNPDCINVNSRTGTTAVKEYFQRQACIYVRMPIEGGYDIVRHAILYKDYDTYCEEPTIPARSECRVCNDNLCNSWSGSQPLPTASSPKAKEFTWDGIHYLCYPRV